MEWLIQLPGFETQTFQDFLGFVIQFIAAQGAELFLLLGQQVQRFVAVVGFNLHQELVDFLLQLNQTSEALTRYLKDGFRGFIGKHVLVQEADGQATGFVHDAFTQVVFSGNQTKQG